MKLARLRAVTGAGHTCWWESFSAFCPGGRPAIYTIYIPYTPFIYSMYTYRYIHIWRAARNVINSPANNFAAGHTVPRDTQHFVCPQ